MMKKLTLASLLVLAAFGAHAGWVQVHAVPNVMTAYTDPALVQRKGDLVSIVMLYSMHSLQTNKAGTQFSSTRLEVVFDCKNSQKLGKTAAFFTSKMAEGAPV